MGAQGTHRKQRRNVLVPPFLCMALVVATGCVAAGTTPTQPGKAMSAYVDAAHEAISACMDRRQTRECKEDKAEIPSLYYDARREVRYQRATRAYLARHYVQWKTVIGELSQGDDQEGPRRLTSQLKRLYELEAELR